MKYRRKWLLFSTAAMVLTATIGGMASPVKAKNSDKPLDLPTQYSAPGKSTKAGNNSTLKLAIMNDAPFKGIASADLSDNDEDTQAFKPGNSNLLFKTDDNHKIVDGGLANQSLDKDAKTATITIRDNAKWSNGAPVTAKDVEYPYEVIANKNSTSQQYSSDFEAIEGMKEYHEGSAKTISGITFPDGENGKKVVIHFTKMAPAMAYTGNTFIWGSADPYEYIKKVPIAKLASASQIRKKPLFTGPYKLDHLVSGESTSWSPNKYYYGKKPNIKHISIQVVSSHNSAAAIKSKKYDFYLGGQGVPTSEFPSVKHLKDYTWVGQPAQSYNYFGFNVGHFDTKKQVSVMDKHSKMGNKKLRQAMMYALDIDSVDKKFGNGLKWRGTTLIPPFYKQYHDDKLVGYKYNMKKANKLLDQAGYKKKGKWRTQPNGKPLTIYYGAMQGSSANESAYRYNIQQWQKAGLNVKMTNGKTMEMNSFYSTLQKPKQNKIDIYSGAWKLGDEPSQTSVYGANAPFNYGHFVTAKNTELLNKMNDEQSWNESYRKQQFYDWQKYMNDQAAYVPESYAMDYAPVNHRVKGYNINAGKSEDFWSDLSLTAANPK
ncbi:oligopeptide ABC transporter substrate-binding protein [Bombilactobacillus thymidiniphilus]|uniref:Oligopeptide ABC transporter substrate-binding protein n=1 Tax=Bombilactobacillus thymidiniphilus TaxID=2923363 RepID=A0ABY4PF87_9LACO|nr:oligopeptide ABC transporter substrate-binding protein [Bombilactobacillus thymidiniphilus]UQS84308.1 oligopeptide ABC transporter substrate-binding protein [Bombilactobacillus thymidiniphilus]